MLRSAECKNHNSDFSMPSVFHFLSYNLTCIMIIISGNFSYLQDENSLHNCGYM